MTSIQIVYWGVVSTQLQTCPETLSYSHSQISIIGFGSWFLYPELILIKFIDIKILHLTQLFNILFPRWVIIKLILVHKCLYKLTLINNLWIFCIPMQKYIIQNESCDTILAPIGNFWLKLLAIDLPLVDIPRGVQKHIPCHPPALFLVIAQPVCVN